jgi:hypothetical protein
VQGTVVSGDSNCSCCDSGDSGDLVTGDTVGGDSGEWCKW